MVKVLDPGGTIIGVYECKEDVPYRVPNRTCSYWFPKCDLELMEVTDPKEQQLLQKTLESCMRELRNK